MQMASHGIMFGCFTGENLEKAALVKLSDSSALTYTFSNVVDELEKDGLISVEHRGKLVSEGLKEPSDVTKILEAVVSGNSENPELKAWKHEILDFARERKSVGTKEFILVMEEKDYVKLHWVQLSRRNMWLGLSTRCDCTYIDWKFRFPSKTFFLKQLAKRQQSNQEME